MDASKKKKRERATPYRSCKLCAMVVVACAGLVSLPILYSSFSFSPDLGFSKMCSSSVLIVPTNGLRLVCLIGCWIIVCVLV